VATVVWPAQLAKLAAMAAAGRRCYMAATTGDLDYTGGRGCMRPSDQWAAPAGGWLTKRARTQRTSLVDIEPGDHICCFYSGLAERDRILLPYLRAGVRDGDKCLCLIDATDPEAMRAKIEYRHQASPKQLLIEAVTKAYLHQGRFSGDYMVDYLDKTVRTALVSDRLPFVRAVGEMSWVLKEPPGADELFTYEGALNEFAPRALLCMYDWRRFSGGMLFEALKMHPKVLINNCLIENLWYLPPQPLNDGNRRAQRCPGF
jgi:hypothetical protein